MAALMRQACWVLIKPVILVALRYNNNRVLGQGFAPYHCTAERWGKWSCA